MEFFDWGILGTFAGATAAVAVLTELTKNIPVIKKVPTQLWSYILALFVMVCATVFQDGVYAGGITDKLFLVIINAAMVALAANGGYEALKRITGGNKDA